MTLEDGTGSIPPALQGSSAAIPLQPDGSARQPLPKLYYAASPCGLQDSNVSDSSYRNADSQSATPSVARRTKNSS